MIKWMEIWKKQGYGTTLYIGQMMYRLKITWKKLYLFIRC